MIIIGGMGTLAAGTYLSNFENEERFQAHAILTESWEALRAVRNNDWNDITNGAHGLRYSNGYWEFFESSDELSGITRQIIVSDIRRNPAGQIVESGGEIDSDSKSMQVQISWTPSENNEKTMSVNTYLHNYQNPSSWPPAPPE